jgi:AcrR family transcriptional regulator
MPGTPRERAREQTISDIVRIGRGQLASVGAAALSLRAVARELGVVSSAVYRYVKNRDELLTLLVVEAYNEVGEEAEHAVAAAAAADYAGQFRALGRAVRRWGLREPARYALLFGSPVPGYEAPAERTTGPGTRVVVRLVETWEDAWRAGAVTSDGEPLTPRRLTRDIARIRREMGLTAPDRLIARGLFAWAALFGCVSWEVFGQYGPGTFAEPGDLFEQHVRVLVEAVGLG